ncbi:PREDICTED: CDGSH iron-sulfur domain-containing protein 1-like [Rhagoletis zephyria]|uniref:CDGSH iron-sulfur domain-containing protein 1-like n=1 Tax=Rhagoletis zephyria TaxID=28612 RepID=UPI00081142E1|nr:PREDICTED: CDGSH iron-sulfur domain-containing protein 1-like [Rhagoletis zephyria]
MQNIELTYVSWATTALAVGYAVYLTMKAPSEDPAKKRLNAKIQLDKPKVVDTCDIEDIKGKGVFCRCWKSSKFPYCDGSHNAHNDTTGDNVGPLIVNKK